MDTQHKVIKPKLDLCIPFCCMYEIMLCESNKMNCTGRTIEKQEHSFIHDAQALALLLCCASSAASSAPWSATGQQPCAPLQNKFRLSEFPYKHQLVTGETIPAYLQFHMYRRIHILFEGLN